jgi:hypothetical protein
MGPFFLIMIFIYWFPLIAPLEIVQNLIRMILWVLFLSHIWKLFRMKPNPVRLTQVLPRPQLIFTSQNLVFWNLFEFSRAEIT